VIGSIGLAASQMQQRMIDDRVDKLRATAQMSMEQQIVAGRLTRQAAVMQLAAAKATEEIGAQVTGSGSDGTGRSIQRSDVPGWPAEPGTIGNLWMLVPAGSATALAVKPACR
jgi:hypothetical protein